MKNYIPILMLICFASFSQAQNNFDNQWKKITQLESEGLTKSAAELVDTIYKNAKSSKDKQQQIKALLHKSKYMLILEEDAQLNIVNLFKSEIEDTKDIPTKRLLENMLATMYWQYFQQNRYQFYNRTKTSEKTSDDFRTWDLETLFHEIHVYYQRSLENGLLLQQESLENYNVILNEVKNSKIYRPTLFDLLSHNALQFYKTSENSITNPAYQFKIDNPSFLDDSEVFINLKLNSKDSTSLELNALKVYQNLIKFHRKDKQSKAFVNVDIERLNFVLQHATFDNKEDVLIKTLTTNAEALKSSPLSALYNYEIASLYQQQGNRYDNSSNTLNNNEAYRWKLKEANEISNLAFSRFPDSYGGKKCLGLMEQIKTPNLSLQTERFVPINSPFRILVSYKNLSVIDFKIYKINQIELEKYNNIYENEEKLKFLNKLKIHQRFVSNLKTELDYQNHTTEILLPSLSNGLYLIMADLHDKTFATSHIQVTDLALLESIHNEAIHYQFINRNNGEPISDASIKISYTNNRNKYFSKNLKTDRFGKFTFKKDGNYYRNVEIKADYKDDIAFFGNYYISRAYVPRKNNDTQHNVFLFTDRSIYRPGQTAYFKGIVIATKDDKTEVYANEKATVKLKNVNGEVVSELELETNEFGSVAGEFILPNDGLTGSFTIEMVCGKKGYTYFSVEEYKRPKFKPEFQPITETFKVNDSITVKGRAVAFAGSNITDAKVVYRVKRQVQYPSWWYWRRPGYYSSEAQEITFGEGTTNNKGEFEITFKALPDESVSKDNLPVFNYEVTADITDVNGETRSTTTVVNVGYHAMTLQVSTPTQIDKTKKEVELTLNSQNLNGEFVPAKGTLKVFKLKSPDAILRARPWDAPDFQVISKEEFKRLFPHDPYNDEHLSTNWDKGEEVFSTDFDTEKEKTITLKKLKKWGSGQYIVIAESKDKFGEDVKAEAYTNLFSEKDKTVADNQLLEASLDKDSYKAGDVAKLTIGSAAKDITVTVEVEKDNNIIVTQLVKLNNSKQTISIPVLEDDLGGFEVHTSFAAYNSYVYQSFSVNVPYPKTDLEIETTTFRDKLQPGQDETWSFKIKGPKGDKVSAELLASMYDASLDEFRAHNWSFSPINRPSYYSRINKNARQSFGTTNFRLFNRFNYPIAYAIQSYDQLNWYGFSFDGSHYYLRQQYLRNKYANEPSYYVSKINTSIGNNFIEGTVVTASDGLPLPGVSVVLKSGDGTQTDFDGKFKIKAKKGETISISYIGMKTLSFIISDDNFYDIYMYEDGSLEEVVVAGYATKTKKAFAGTATIADKDGGYDYMNENARVHDSAYFEASGKLTTSDNLEDPEYYIKMEKAKIVPKKETIQIRKNLNETAFFFPQLQTDEDGNVSFNFKAPEALTKWKLQLLAHTKTLESSVKQLEAVTQKELMVIPNAPRFLREGDQITISTKIANLTEKELSGVAQLILTNPITGEDISNEIVRLSAVETSSIEQNFNVEREGNTQVSWKLRIPEGLQAVQYKIVAQAGDFSDGEQNALPVLSNRMLVTETLPMWVKSNETKTFTLDKLKDNTSTTLTNHKLTLEMTSNPAWYAVQALPYLMEYPYDCNEQTFSRYYANALAKHIVTSNPKIEAVFNQWKSSDALLSNLEKNQELKSLLIQETPWLRDAQSETEQKKRIGLLFDLNKMNNELSSALNKLKQNQLPSGAWPWFNGGYANRFISQHIISGFGHLNKLGVSLSAVEGSSENRMIQNAIQYLDTEFIKEYKDIRKYNKDADLSKDHLSYTQLHYMYVRSFYPEVKASKEVETIMDYYKSQMQKYWLKRSLYAKGLMTLTLHRMNDDATAGKILKSLEENSITSDELGMYWKANTNSWYWHQAPIETQALLIEAFSEVGVASYDVTLSAVEAQKETTNIVDNLKIWLLKNKQTNKWETTKATTEAVYALLLQGNSWLEVTEMVDVKVGNETITPSTLDNVKVEAGTGYYKTSWTGKEITAEQANVTISKKGDGIAWGALYWQYFEDLDKITSAETPLKLSKKLFLKTNTDKGEEISEITEDTQLNIGDLVRVRIELRSDRDMEFVHLKDMRAAGFEPINVLSQYKWQDGLGYYESTKDAATNFFMDYLPKGVYVFEYDLRVNNAGDMSNGISTIQSMYAPEFSSHSEGVRVTIE